MANYLGQGALIMDHPELISSPFYHAGPLWARWPLIILATMATSKFILKKHSLFYTSSRSF
jgi:KUP system potassium uptake protein